MSADNARISELQNALRKKMSDNKEIADSFKVEEGTVVVSTEQKAAFDSNMRDIKEIKGLIEGLESMDQVNSWSSEPASDSVGAAAARLRDLTPYARCGTAVPAGPAPPRASAHSDPR